MDRADFQTWLDRYVEAWRTYDRAAIAALFSDDATYRYRPADEPVRGRDAIVDSWLEDERTDPPGSFDAHYEPLAIDGEMHVASGWSRYHATASEPEQTYRNIFAIRFDAEGRATDFTEWFVLDRDSERAAETARAAAIGGVDELSPGEGPMGEAVPHTGETTA